MATVNWSLFTLRKPEDLHIKSIDQKMLSACTFGHAAIYSYQDVLMTFSNSQHDVEEETDNHATSGIMITRKLLLTSCVWRHRASDVMRTVTATSGRSASKSGVCQILNFENRTIIRGDMAIFVKAPKRKWGGAVQSLPPSLRGRGGHRKFM